MTVIASHEAQKKRKMRCRPITVVQGSERHRSDKDYSRQLKGEINKSAYAQKSKHDKMPSLETGL